MLKSEVIPKIFPSMIMRGLVLALVAALFYAPLAQARQKAEDSELSKLQSAAKHGDSRAELSLGTACHLGNGVKQDDVEAVKWWLKAADQGNPMAQLLVGNALSEGKGIAKNDEKAVKWWRKAADQGDADAQNNLGTAYHNGMGVKKDAVEAVRWWQKAAEQGGIDVELSLGAAFYNGDGVPKDPVLAYMWFSLASAQDKQAAAKLLDQVEETMTQQQIVKAQGLAHQWTQQHSALAH